MLNGEKVSLSAIDRGDLQRLLEWRNNPEFRRYFREYRELNMAQQERWFETKVISDKTIQMFAIRRREDQLLLGCCGLVYIDWLNRHADLSLYVGWNDVYIDDEGYAEEGAELLIAYGFGELGLNKIWTEIFEFDDRKDRLYHKLGFSQDGLLRRHHWHDGRWWDSKILSVLVDEKIVK